jgi:hypothetical protein
MKPTAPFRNKLSVFAPALCRGLSLSLWMSVSDEDSVRSRAAAGICYVAVGGVICAAAVLLMRSGVPSISLSRRRPIPLEMVAGIAGIVVFMGFLQLVIAFILKHFTFATELNYDENGHIYDPLHPQASLIVQPSFSRYSRVQSVA